MDILNFISWIKGGRQVTTVDASKTLIPLGLKDNRRDDGYLAGAITVEDLAVQVGGLQTVAVDGITITGDGTLGDPLVAAGGSSYKVYTALLTQSGTDAPVATVLENTIGAISFEYAYPGTYYVNSPSLFINNKTSVTISPIGAAVPQGTIFLNIVRQSNNQLQIVTKNIIPPFNGLVDNGFLSQGNLIEIRVYN